MRMRIDRSTVYPAASADGTEWAYLDSLLGVHSPGTSRTASFARPSAPPPSL